VRNCQVEDNGANSDHKAVQMQLNLTPLKYKEKASLDSGNIDWRKICKEDVQRKLYNKYLLDLTSRDMAYDSHMRRSQNSCLHRMQMRRLIQSK
jgi:hypothetical protein